jgi:hypothetical protein
MKPLGNSISIGKTSDNDIVINSQYISRNHATITVQNDNSVAGNNNVFLMHYTDHSTNGTGIDGRMVKNSTFTFSYTPGGAHPQILLAGRPEHTLNWNELLNVLKNKGLIDSDNNAVPPVYKQQNHESLSVWLCILSFLIPLLGWILWGVWHSSDPEKASSAAKWAWAGFAFGFITNLLYMM